MKKIIAYFVSIVIAVAFAGIMPVFPVSAVTILPADRTTLRAGYTFLGIEGKYITQIQESLDLINQIRLEACTEGVINPESGFPLTAEDYVPIQWSADLEYIARLRAAEASLTMDHKRTNGEEIWFKSPGGVSSCAEVIAWNWGETMTQGIDQWYGEKYDWVNNTGGVTGHYTSLISPNHRYVGLGAFCSFNTYYHNTTVGEFSDSYNPDTSRGSPTGMVIQTLEVKDEYISDYSLSGTDSLQVTASVTITDYKGGTYLTKDLTVVGASAENIEWKSSDEKTVTVSNGNLTRISCGSSTITATLPNKTVVEKEVFYDHSYNVVSKRPATCKEEGMTTKVCSVCGKMITEKIPKTDDHIFETISTTPATCIEEGKIEKQCKVCGLTVTEVIPKTNEHTYEVISAVPPTCKDEGIEEKECKVCGDTITEIIPKTDQHTFGQWETTVNPTEDTDGIETRTCTICGVKETRVLPANKPVNQETAPENQGDITEPSENVTEAADTAPTGQTLNENPSPEGESTVPSSNGESNNNSPAENDVTDSSEKGNSSNGTSALFAVILGVSVAGGVAALIINYTDAKKKTK